MGEHAEECTCTHCEEERREMLDVEAEGIARGKATVLSGIKEELAADGIDIESAEGRKIAVNILRNAARYLENGEW